MEKVYYENEPTNGRVHTLEGIKARCLEEGECWIWQGAVSHGADCQHWGTPCMSVNQDGKRKTRPVRRVVWELDRGRVFPVGRHASPGCGNRLCVSPHCAKALTPQESKRLAASYGAFSSAAKIRKSTATKRARSRITDHMVQQARDARTAKEAAAQTGISLSHCKAIRRGAARVEFSPFVGLFPGTAANDSARRAA